MSHQVSFTINLSFLSVFHYKLQDFEDNLLQIVRDRGLYHSNYFY